MPAHVPDERAIEVETRKLLKSAGIKVQFPTPVEAIVAAAGLEQPRDSLLSEQVIAEAPKHLQRAVRRLGGGRLLALLDRRRREVHVDPSIQNEGKRAFATLHEVAHDILPWQRFLAYADSTGTLAPSVNSLFEREANLGASNLLFQHDAFTQLANEYTTEHASIMELSKIVGASGHSTFRRYVSSHNGVVAGIVLELSPCSFDPLAYRRNEVVLSAAWPEMFGDYIWPTVLRLDVYPFIEQAGAARISLTPVKTECSLASVDNTQVNLTVELYSNQYRLFALIWKPRREHLKRKRLIVPGVAKVA